MSNNKTNIITINSEYYDDSYNSDEYDYMSELIMGKDEDGLINGVINDLHIDQITIMHVKDWLVKHPDSYLTIEHLIPIIIDSVINEDEYSGVPGVIIQLEGKISERDYYRLLEAMNKSKSGRPYIGEAIMCANINVEEMLNKYYDNLTMKQITNAWCRYANLRKMLFTHIICSDAVDLFMDTINGANSYEKNPYSWTVSEIYRESNIQDELRLGILL